MYGSSKFSVGGMDKRVSRGWNKSFDKSRSVSGDWLQYKALNSAYSPFISSVL